MAMQAGMGLSKVAILVGAGYTGSILLRNGKMSDIIGELQSMVKGLENSKDASHSDHETSLLANQLDRLAREVQRMSASRPITVLNGSSQGNASSVILPLVPLGLLGYGYMWWKGYSLGDLMYVTKRSMANAVSGMTKHLEQVSSALAATKRHLTQRIENLDGKVDEQNVNLKEIKKEVIDANGKIGRIGDDVKAIEMFLSTLDAKMSAIEGKQDLACDGVLYLCQFVQDKGGRAPEFLLNMAKSGTGGKRALGFSEPTSLKGLQHITESMERESIQSVDNEVKTLSRTASVNQAMGVS